MHIRYEFITLGIERIISVNNIVLKYIYIYIYINKKYYKKKIIEKRNKNEIKEKKI